MAGEQGTLNGGRLARSSDGPAACGGGATITLPRLGALSWEGCDGMKYDWFRAYHELIYDPKIRRLPLFAKWLWVTFLCLASMSPRRGDILGFDKVALEDAAGCSILDEEDTLGAVDLFIEAKMLRKVKGGWRVLHWDKRQYDKPSDRPEAVRGRVSKHREKRAGNALVTPSGNAPVTPSNALDKKRRYTDKRRREEKREERTPPLPPLAVLWNDLVPSPKVLRVSGTRLAHLTARMETYPDLDWWRQVLDRLLATPFLRGKNDRGWVADFDWLVKNDENPARVLEGKYDTKRQTLEPEPLPAKQRAWLDEPEPTPEQRQASEIARTRAAELLAATLASLPRMPA